LNACGTNILANWRDAIILVTAFRGRRHEETITMQQGRKFGTPVDYQTTPLLCRCPTDRLKVHPGGCGMIGGFPPSEPIPGLTVIGRFGVFLPVALAESE
jgi:hypothetical protein